MSTEIRIKCDHCLAAIAVRAKHNKFLIVDLCDGCSNTLTVREAYELADKVKVGYTTAHEGPTPGP